MPEVTTETLFNKNQDGSLSFNINVKGTVPAKDVQILIDYLKEYSQKVEEYPEYSVIRNCVVFHELMKALPLESVQDFIKAAKN
jgi:hemerythrin-like domain-containing protein